MERTNASSFLIALTANQSKTIEMTINKEPICGRVESTSSPCKIHIK